MTVSRRDLLVAGGGTIAFATAGCLSAPDNVSGDDGDPTGAAAFFPLYDWATHVGGDVIEFDTPVEIGQLGHGWEPGGTIVPEIAQHDVFVYLGTPEFRWAVDVASELEDSNYQTRLIDAMTALPRDELLPFVGTHDHETHDEDEHVAYDPTTVEVHGVEVLVDDDVVAEWHDDHWDGGLPEIPREGSLTLEVRAESAAGDTLAVGEDGQLVVDVRVPDQEPQDVVDIDVTDGTIVVRGRSTGETGLVFELRAGDAVRYDTTANALDVTVGATEAESDHSFHDPHVWVDPVHAHTMVDHIANELAAVLPDHADTIRSNADVYLDRLASVDQQFEQLMADAELSVAVFVGHDAFQYLEHRYGFSLRTPVGVSPNADASIEDLVGLRDTIDRHDIETILFDPFDAPNPDEDVPRAARVLLEETGAQRAEPLTSAEGLTPAWRDADYGWVEQMEEINLPSLERALRAR